MILYACCRNIVAFKGTGRQEESDYLMQEYIAGGQCGKVACSRLLLSSVQKACLLLVVKHAGHKLGDGGIGLIVEFRNNQAAHPEANGAPSQAHLHRCRLLAMEHGHCQSTSVSSLRHCRQHDLAQRYQPRQHHAHLSRPSQSCCQTGGLWPAYQHCKDGGLLT